MIDVSFDFTTDTKGFWDGFWERKDGLGSGGADPDNASRTLQKYHQILWSKQLPNGEVMDLHTGTGANYLTWKNYRFGSDSIIVSFRYQRYRYMMDQVRERVSDFQAFFEEFIRKGYTIGGAIIFPKHKDSINQNKGTNKYIADRWDLTLECIRRFYLGEYSPLYNVLLNDKGFFDLFVDFKGYIDYFFLQDAVSLDYTEVNLWCGNADFAEEALPKTVEDYFTFINNELDFTEKRNKRIQQSLSQDTIR